MTEGKTARQNLHERRELALINTRRALIAALFHIEEAAKYPDLTQNDPRNELRQARSAVEEAEMMARFAINERG